MPAPALLFVPLDDRPVTMDMVVDLGRAAGVDVRTPDRRFLGGRDKPGDAEAIWEWLRREVGRTRPSALIASVEMLCCGGLVASRKSAAPYEEVAPRLRRIAALAASIPTYLSAVIPRTPREPTDEDAQDSITGPHRARHIRLNADLVEMAAQGMVRFALIGQDDTWPRSPSQVDRQTLQERADSMDAANVQLTSGADELNARLLARWLNVLTGAVPAVRIVYTYPEGAGQIPLYEATPLSQTVGEHLHSAGLMMIPSPVKPNSTLSPPMGGESGSEGREDPEDILLWVHNFEGQQLEARDQPGAIDARKIGAVMEEVRDAVRAERVVALADVRFANGADRALVTQLLAETRFAGIVAYAGWNTCSNSLGSAIAQAVVAYHLRAGTVPALFTRLLDDWGYQAVVRPHLAQWLEQRGGSAAHLADHEGVTAAEALARLRAEALPAIEQIFPDQSVALRRVVFPWHRLFEIRLDLEVAVRTR